MEPLKVDAELLGAAGQRLLSAAQGLPEAPEPFTPSHGSDALSQVLAADVPRAEQPFLEGLPPLKTAAIGTAESVVEAARRYATTDRDLQDKIESSFNDPGVGNSSGSQGTPGTGADGVGPVAGAAPPLGGPAMSSGGGMGQLAGMLSQMPQQAGQIPQQMAGSLGSLRDSAMKGLQQVGEQIGEVVSKSSEEEPQLKELQRAEDQLGKGHSSAGESTAERAPLQPLESPDRTSSDSSRRL